MSFASWVLHQSMKGLDVVEVVAERDIRYCQNSIERLTNRMEVAKAFVDFTREVRIEVMHYVIEISDIEEEKREKVAKAGTRLMQSFPARPRVSGFLQRRLIPVHVVPGTTTNKHATV